MTSCASPIAARAAEVRVQVVIAWPRRHVETELLLDAGATVADAIAACGFDLAGIAGQAIHGERVEAVHALCDGDRIELLRPLQADPKDARRRRAARATARG
jgi:putative ubiquitin-RnfH superfamily antitoxin RatB of RatAB toxin-antitoxin module